jgi:uncharacterized protein with gpF-like domain
MRGISRQIAEVASAIRDGEAWEAAFPDDVLETVYAHIFERVFLSFATEAYNAISEHAQKALSDIWTDIVKSFLESQGARRVAAINEATRQFIRDVITLGLDEAWGVHRTARELRKRWEDVSKTRAERIARTEIVGASNRAGIEGARRAASELGLTLEKEWISTHDSRTRTSPPNKFDHMVANGQRRALDEPFDVSGEALMQPGDHNGSAGNVINCRCTTAYHVMD